MLATGARFPERKKIHTAGQDIKPAASQKAAIKRATRSAVTLAFGAVTALDTLGAVPPVQRRARLARAAGRRTARK